MRIITCAIGTRQEYDAISDGAELVTGVAGIFFGIIAGVAAGGEVL